MDTSQTSVTGAELPLGGYRPFDLGGPLPVGLTVLEASAGTGKTYTVGALVARYLAEGTAQLSELLVVTFGRAASEELRERIRIQLVQAESALRDPNLARQSTDSLIRALVPIDSTAAEIDLRRQRLARALTDFDAITISTTHQFCLQALSMLGTAGDVDQGVRLVDDLDDLLVDVVDDLYLRGFGRPGADPPDFTLSQAHDIARACTQDPHATLVPEIDDTGSAAARRLRFAAAVRREFESRKTAHGVLGYDDLLSRLARALTQPAAQQRLRSRWKVVLVDEFQDTDPVQWEVIQRAFVGHGSVILIGDPKQAIYAFRGADVRTYLAAAQTADQHFTLATNHRADSDLVAALQVLLGGAALGDPQIIVRPVIAAQQVRRLSVSTNPSASIRMRVVLRQDVNTAANKPIAMVKVQRLIAKDLASDISRILSSAMLFNGRSLVPADIAVLVAKHQQATLVRDTLAEFGIPAVLGGGRSVYATLAAREWLTVLQSLNQPGNKSAARSAGLTSFIGLDAQELADPEAAARVDELLRTTLDAWRDILARNGPAALIQYSMAHFGLGRHLLSTPSGERRITDLRHLGQELQAKSAEGAGLPSLIEWLGRRIQRSGLDRATERIRRLDSDAAAVQVVTLHASKGLQYPIVYIPFEYERWVGKEGMLKFHTADGTRGLDICGPGTPARAERERLAASELARETLRLLYVGLTRAQSQVVTWWAPTKNTKDAALHRLLFGRQVGQSAIPDQTELPTDEQALARFAELANLGGAEIERVSPVTIPEHGSEPASRVTLEIAPWTRAVDTGWRRSSYSSLISTVNHHSGQAESEVSVEVDQALVINQRGPTHCGSDLVERQLREQISPMATFPVGAAFGTMIHAVLEAVVPTAQNLGQELTMLCREQLANHRMDLDVTALAEALRLVLTSPLGPIGAGLTLADIGPANRLTELDFEMPLAGGDLPSTAINLGQFGQVLRSHLTADDPMVSYADRLDSTGLSRQPLRGFLTGSIDAVLRLPGDRYLIVDYKTNWLADPGTDHLTAWHYRPAILGPAMIQADYPLQALLYQVALHRYLRWRVADYQPDRNLAGSAYLFIRGMIGPDTPVVDSNPCGVFAWNPPTKLITDLSDVLDRGSW